MSESMLIGLASIIILGIAAQWLAWFVRLPAILMLLVFGFLAGPVAGILQPDVLLGDLLPPFVSLSVAVILLEGGLSLKISELRTTGSVVRNLISIGALVTWLIASVSAYFIIGLDIPLSILFGSILIVTGPTVIIPLLRHVRPLPRLASILKWEGILIDPVGAMMAVLVFEAILLNRLEETPVLIILGVFKTALIGGAGGVLSAVILIQLFKRYWVPDFLQNPVTLIIALGAYAGSNLFQAESGLLTVTIMGIVLGNQKTVSIKHIIEFKENVRVLLISSVFVLLAAKLNMQELMSLKGESLIFLGVLIFVARPVSVFLSTIGSTLSFREKLFISCVAPRGIIAAAVASVLALRLFEEEYVGAGQLVPLTFIMIIGTVLIYGLLASPIARLLKLSEPNPQGVLIVGAHRWARRIAMALKSLGLRVLLVDTNRRSVTQARMEGLNAYCGTILSEEFIFENQIGGIGRLLALTANDENNSLAALHFSDVFGSNEVYQLPLESKGKNGQESIPKYLRGRFLFGKDITFDYLTERFAKGALIKVTRLTEEFDFNSFQRLYGGRANLLFCMQEDGTLRVFTLDNPIEPRPGQKLISLVDAVKKKPERT
jgi:NhaP-type Na+/H+ or K+/H+ antiporter